MNALPNSGNNVNYTHFYYIILGMENSWFLHNIIHCCNLYFRLLIMKKVLRMRRTNWKLERINGVF